MKIKYIIPFLTIFALLIYSCDKVDPPYIENVNYCDGNKKVLLEDYTGHGCVNCPAAAVLAHNLNESFCADEEKLVIISVHAGYFAQPYIDHDSLFSADFTTEAGNEWDTYFGISAQGNPNGLVDRVKTSTGFVIGPDDWGNIAGPLLEQPAKAGLTIFNEFNPDNSTLNTTITTDFFFELEGTYKLIVCVTQDNIIAPQKNKNPEVGPTPIDTNYVHNHVLRGSLNGSWGENIVTSTVVSAGTSITKEYSHVFPDAWIPEDCHLVAFIYDEATKQVLQAEESPVIDIE